MTLLDRVEKNPDEVAEEFKDVTQSLFTKENIFVNITAPENDYKKIEKRVMNLTQKLSAKKQTPAILKFGNRPSKRSLFNCKLSTVCWKRSQFI